MSEVLLPPSVPRFRDHAATLRRIWVWTEPGSSAPLPPPHLSLPAVTSSRSLRPPEQRRRGSTREGRQRGQTKGASLSQGQPGAHGLLPARRGRTCRGSPALQHCGPGLRQPLLRREQSRTAAARTHRGATGGLPPPGGPRRPKNDRNGPIRAAAPGPPGCPAQPPPPPFPAPHPPPRAQRQRPRTEPAAVSHCHVLTATAARGRRAARRSAHVTGRGIRGSGAPSRAGGPQHPAAGHGARGHAHKAPPAARGRRPPAPLGRAAPTPSRGARFQHPHHPPLPRPRPPPVTGWQRSGPAGGAPPGRQQQLRRRSRAVPGPDVPPAPRPAPRGPCREL